VKVGERASVDLVSFNVRLSDCLHLQRIRDDHTRYKRRQYTRNRHAVAGGLDHHFIGRPQTFAKTFKRRPGHIDPAGMSKNAIFPDHQWWRADSR
jgi:hypothetical protein